MSQQELLSPLGIRAQCGEAAASRWPAIGLGIRLEYWTERNGGLGRGEDL